jgi:hypothetical protein
MYVCMYVKYSNGGGESTYRIIYIYIYIYINRQEVYLSSYSAVSTGKDLDDLRVHVRQYLHREGIYVPSLKYIPACSCASIHRERGNIFERKGREIIHI